MAMKGLHHWQNVPVRTPSWPRSATPSTRLASI